MFGQLRKNEKTQYDHPRLGMVILVCSWRARRITLSVRPSGETRLTYPRLVSRKRALEFLESRVEWVEQSRVRITERTIPKPQYTTEQIEMMRREAKALLPERVAFWAHKFGFKYGRVSIRASRSKWGSCSATCNISLSLFLMILPEHLRDYVILHELAHTVHHNHSPRFHALVNALTNGHEKALARELKEYSTR